MLVGANGSGKTNVVEFFLFLRRALRDELERRPYAPHTEWGHSRNLTWEASGAPIRAVLDFSLQAGHRESTGLSYSVVFAPDEALATIAPVYERIELPGHSYVLERKGDSVVATAPRQVLEPLIEKISGLGLSEDEARTVCRDGLCQITQRLESRQGQPPPVLVSPSAVAALERVKNLFIELAVLGAGQAAILASPVTPVGLSIGQILAVMREWLSRIVVLRQLDYSTAKWPHSRFRENVLRPRGENLAEILYQLMREPEARDRIEATLAALFPWLELEVGFNEYGQIGIVFYEKRAGRRIQLYPSMVPDGVVKALAVLAAALTRPSVLAVDEVENSLHAALIDYLIRELGDLEDPVVVTTHSPVVVDIAGPERTLLLRRGEDGSTRVDKLAPRDLWEKLRDEGVSLSDYYLYAA